MEKEKEDFSKINIPLIKAVVQEKKEALDRAVSMMQNVIDKPEDYNSVIKDSVYANLVAELSCSIIAGDLKDLEEVPRYQYTKSGCCYFVVDDVTFEVVQLMGMRHPKTGSDLDEQILTSDSAMPVCYHLDGDDDDYCCSKMHILDRNCWLYGATGDEFDEFKPVHTEFIDAAKAYIKEKGKEFLLRTQEEDDE